MFPPCASHNQPSPPQSLLSTRQSKWAKEMLGNVRLSCCVAGALNLVVKVGGADGCLHPRRLYMGRACICDLACKT